MSYQVLARKWRPKKFEDVVGQSHISKSLQNAIAQERVGHAYIFTGTRGIGKTSMARIFSKALRCENRLADGNPCLECNNCLSIDKGQDVDVIEIDGASNNGVEDIRQLIENLQYLPVSGKYKIYIIDEVHMLTVNAFNALLKTLEEPPEHVIFMLATTNPEKLLGTVLSRCQRFDYRNARIDDLTSHLKMISDEEGVSFSDESLIRQIAKQANGSVRDALSLLEQVLSYSADRSIDEKTLNTSLGLASFTAIKQILEAILAGDSESLAETYQTLLHENVDIQFLSLSILDSLYAVIESIDFKKPEADIHLIGSDILKEISSAELFWIYENIAKDMEFALASQSAEKMIYVILQKITKRREFLTTSLPGISTTKKKTLTEKLEEEPLVEAEQVNPEETIENELAPDEDELATEKVEPVLPKDLTWDGFLIFLNEKNPATAANLEQGNMLDDLFLDHDKVIVSIGFPTTAKLFYDHLNTPEAKQKIKARLAEFFEKKLESVELTLKYLSEDEDFKSTADLNIIAEEKKNAELEENIKNHKYIKQAEEIFRSKLDKVVLNKK